MTSKQQYNKQLNFSNQFMDYSVISLTLCLDVRIEAWNEGIWNWTAIPPFGLVTKFELGNADQFPAHPSAGVRPGQIFPRWEPGKHAETSELAPSRNVPLLTKQNRATSTVSRPSRNGGTGGQEPTSSPPPSPDRKSVV